MTEPVWNKFLTDRDKAVFDSAGYGTRGGYGKKPALLVIDVNYNFCGDTREPILDSIKKYRNSCGEDAWDALPVIAKLAEAARAKRIPVIYSTGDGRDDGWDRGGWAWKNSRNKEDQTPPEVRTSNRDGNDIMDEIAPGPKDIVIRKLKPSVFNGTALIGHINNLGADSLIGIDGAKLTGGIGDNLIDARSFSGDATLVGRSGDDILYGGSGRDQLFGGAGNDLAVGGPGYDIIKGQGGRDSLAGGEGQDQIVGEASEIDDEFAVMDDWADLTG